MDTRKNMKGTSMFIDFTTAKEVYDSLYSLMLSPPDSEKKDTYWIYIMCPKDAFINSSFPVYLFGVSLHYSIYKPQTSSYKDLYPYIHFKRLRDTFIPNSNLYGQFFRFTRDEFIKYMSTSKWIVLEEAKISL